MTFLQINFCDLSDFLTILHQKVNDMTNTITCFLMLTFLTEFVGSKADISETIFKKLIRILRHCNTSNH